MGRTNREWYRHRQLEAASDSIEAFEERGVVFDTQPITNACLEVVEKEWSEAGRKYAHWDWAALRREFGRDGGWATAIWSDGDLCALIAAKAFKDHIFGYFIEGSPVPGTALKAQRSAIAIDLLLRYAELCGVNEIRIKPVNDALVQWYQDVAPFEPFPDADNPAYYVLRLEPETDGIR